MKKILHVSHSLETGGGPLYIHKIVNDLPSIDHYVAGNPGYYYGKFEQSIGSSKVFKLHGKNLFLNVLSLYRIIVKNQISTIHCHGRGASLYCRILKLLRRRIAMIYTIHGFHPDTLAPLFRWLYIFYERLCFSLTDIIVNVSRSERKRFIEIIRPNDLKKIYYIPNYISEQDLKSGLHGLQLDNHYVNFLFIGRLSWEKGIDILMDAWKNVTDPNTRLYIIGYGPYKRLVEQESNNRLCYLGKIENAGSLIPYFDAIIIPSRFEGMPFIGLECMISKANVIVTPATGLTDLFSSETAWVSQDMTPPALQKSISDFIMNLRNYPSSVSEKPAKNYERVKSEFSKKNVETLNVLYQSL